MFGHRLEGQIPNELSQTASHCSLMYVRMLTICSHALVVNYFRYGSHIFPYMGKHVQNYTSLCSAVMLFEIVG